MLPHIPMCYDGRSGAKVRFVFHCLYAGWSPVVAEQGGLVSPGLVSNIRDGLLVLEKNGYLLKFEKQVASLMVRTVTRQCGETYSTIGRLIYGKSFTYDPRDPFKIIHKKTNHLVMNLKKPEDGFHPFK